MGMSDAPFEVMCPDCGAMSKVDPVTRSVISHTPAARLDLCSECGGAEEQGRSAVEEVRGSREESEGESEHWQTPAGL